MVKTDQIRVKNWNKILVKPCSHRRYMVWAEYHNKNCFVPRLSPPSTLSASGYIKFQGSTIGVRRVCTYVYFYEHTHDLKHAYLDTYAHFFRFFKIFKIFLILITLYCFVCLWKRQIQLLDGCVFNCYVALYFLLKRYF